MAKNTMEIMLGGIKYLAVDLTQPLRLDTEVYPGDPRPKRIEFSNIEKTGWQHFIHSIGDHNFQPHADAPNHQNKDLKDKGIESFGHEYCFNRAVFIDLADSYEKWTFDEIKYLAKVEREHLEHYSKQLANVGAAVIRTGYDLWIERNKQHSPEFLPYLTKECAEFIASFPNIKVVGIDSLTIDLAGSHGAHMALCDRLVVESLVNLHGIPLKSGQEFDLQTSPIKIEGATGGPVTAYAFVKLKKK